MVAARASHRLELEALAHWHPQIGIHKGAVRKQHLQAYLNEFAFRFNRRFWRGPAFLRALGLVVTAEEWPEYKTLYKAKVGVEAGGWPHPDGHARGSRVDACLAWIRAYATEEGNVKLKAWLDAWPEVAREVIRDTLLREDRRQGIKPGRSGKARFQPTEEQEYP